MGKNTNKFILAIVIILMISFGFYWLEVRSTLIVKKCSQSTNGISAGADREFLIKLKELGYSKEEAVAELIKVKDETSMKNELEKQKESVFQKCLRDNGVLK